MDKQNNKLTKTKNHYKTDKKSLVIGGVIVLLIAISPYLFYLYESFPELKIWETFLFTLETSFPSWYSFAWYFSGKAIPLYLLLLWFFTCKHWWHWIILVPIAMYSFQLWGVLNESNDLDSLSFYYVVPLMMVIIPSVYVIRAKLFDKVRGDDLKAFEEELGQKRTLWQQIKDLFR
ncbi:MAG: hypothetical protein ACI9SJ_000644 [Flavobacteriaceae bacterium]|jgi:hypothetical protein